MREYFIVGGVCAAAFAGLAFTGIEPVAPAWAADAPRGLPITNAEWARVPTGVRVIPATPPQVQGPPIPLELIQWAPVLNVSIPALGPNGPCQMPHNMVEGQVTGTLIAFNGGGLVGPFTLRLED